jgi:GDP-L-fucose synthase
MTLAGTRVLVAGGAGFLGVNLIRALGSADCRIRATLHRRPPVDGLPVADYVQADFTRMEDCRAAVRDIDIVFMCAANSSGAAAITGTPLAHVTPNVVTNTQLLDAAYHAGVRKVVFVSSAAAYPSVKDRPAREDDMFAGDPEDVYFASGWMKRYGEILCRLYAQKLEHPMATVVVRPSNCYGPFDKFDPERSHVTAALIRRVVERQRPFVVWGTGDDVRDLIYIDDFIEGLLLAARCDDPFLVVNIASGHGVSVKQILETILEVDGWRDPDIRFDAARPSTVAQRLVDVTKARECLGFSARTSLDEGLRRTLAWYREHQGSWTK